MLFDVDPYACKQKMCSPGERVDEKGDDEGRGERAGQVDAGEDVEARLREGHLLSHW